MLYQQTLTFRDTMETRCCSDSLIMCYLASWSVLRGVKESYNFIDILLLANNKEILLGFERLKIRNATM